MLRIRNSYSRHRSITVLLLDVFFCRDNAAFWAEGPVPRWRAAVLWTEGEFPPCGATRHTRLQQTLHELTLLQHKGLLTLQRSQWSPSTADPCERNSHSLGFALITWLKSGNSEGWGISFFLMDRASLRTGKLFIPLFLTPMLLWFMGVQREEKCNFRNTGKLSQTTWGHL